MISFLVKVSSPTTSWTSSMNWKTAIRPELSVSEIPNCPFKAFTADRVNSFISLHVSLLHEHMSIAITISTGHPSSVWACDVQHDSSHSHMPGYVVSWPLASHEASPIISCGKSTAFVRPKPINRLKALIFRPLNLITLGGSPM